jgi:hypothetical protein
MSASLIGHLGSSTFRLSAAAVSMSLAGSRFSSESAQRALPSWDSRTRWNNLSGGLAVRLTVGPSRHAISPHPSSREGHHSTARWSSKFSPIGFDPVRFSCCCRNLFSGPAELGAVNPDAMQDHGQPACQGHDRFFYPAAPAHRKLKGLDWQLSLDARIGAKGLSDTLATRRPTWRTHTDTSCRRNPRRNGDADRHRHRRRSATARRTLGSYEMNSGSLWRAPKATRMTLFDSSGLACFAMQ